MTLLTLQYPVRLTVIALFAIGLAACSGTSESGREGGGGEGVGEHGRGGEGSDGGESGEGAESGEGGEESGRQYRLSETFWRTRKGVRLALRYDDATQSFRGTATNITDATIPRVRVEVHLSNGVELGPTTTMDLAPGQTIDVSLPATGQTFAEWGAHAESDGPARMAAFTPSLGDWAVVGGVPLGIESQGHRMSAWYTSQGGAWTPHLTPPGPQHQPTGNATWTGEWAGHYGSDPAIGTGAANVTVTLGANTTEADLTLQGVPTLGTLRWNDMQVTDGRFMGNTAANANNYEAVGQFGGVNQAGVAGHASGPDFRSVFYGNKD